MYDEQAVHELNEESKLSAACTTSDHQNCQAGLSWIHERGKGLSLSHSHSHIFIVKEQFFFESLDCDYLLQND